MSQPGVDGEASTPPDLTSVSNRKAFIYHFLNKSSVDYFIEATNRLQIEAKHEEGQVDSGNITCKDDIDRGGSALAYHDFSSTDSNVTDIVNHAMAPAMIVKKRAIIPHRFHDLTNCLRTRNQGFPADGVQVPKH